MSAPLPVLQVTIPNTAASMAGPAKGSAAAPSSKSKDFAHQLTVAAKNADRKTASADPAAPTPDGSRVPPHGNALPPVPSVISTDLRGGSAQAANAASEAAVTLAAAAADSPTTGAPGATSWQTTAISEAAAQQALLANQTAGSGQPALAGVAGIAGTAGAGAAGASGKSVLASLADPAAAQQLPSGALAAAKTLADEAMSASAAIAQGAGNQGPQPVRLGGAAANERARTAGPSSAARSGGSGASAAADVAAAATRGAGTSPLAQAAASTDPTLSALGSSFNAQLQVDFTDSISGLSSLGKTGGVSAASAAPSADGSATAVTIAAASATAAATAPAQFGAFAAALGVADKHGRDTNIDASSGIGAAGGSAAAAAPSGNDGGAAALAASANQPPVAISEAGSAGLAKIDAGINSPEFSQALADRVSYMAGNNLNGATLQVSPPQLGPIELRVSVENGHAQVWLSSHNPATLDALQSSTPKLREMLSSQGFTQVSVDVSQRSFQDRSAYRENSQWTPASENDAAPALAAVGASGSPRAALGVLDAYA